jgi:hypothetical protein
LASSWAILWASHSGVGLALSAVVTLNQNDDDSGGLEEWDRLRPELHGSTDKTLVIPGVCAA